MAKVDNILLNLHNSAHQTKAKFNNNKLFMIALSSITLLNRDVII